MKKMIILDITEEDYNAGLEMLGGAMMIAYTHGMWDVQRGNRVFGPNGWLPSWDKLEDAPTEKSNKLTFTECGSDLGVETMTKGEGLDDASKKKLKELRKVKK